MTLTVMAADRQPSITITSEKNFRIIVDGRSYAGSNITISPWELYGANHIIQVYDMQKSFFGNFGFGRRDRDARARMISSSSFWVGRNDVMIHIDCFGRITVSQVPIFNQFDRDGSHQYDHRYMDQKNGYDQKNMDNRNGYDHRDMNTRSGSGQPGQGFGHRF